MFYFACSNQSWYQFLLLWGLGWGATYVCDMLFFFSYPLVLPLREIESSIFRRLVKTHMCWRHAGCLWADVCVQTRAISEGQMGPSLWGCLVAQSTMAPDQTSRTATTSKDSHTRVCARINYLMQTYLMLQWLKGSVCNFWEYSALSASTHCGIKVGRSSQMRLD